MAWPQNKFTNTAKPHFSTKLPLQQEHELKLEQRPLIIMQVNSDCMVNTYVMEQHSDCMVNAHVMEQHSDCMVNTYVMEQHSDSVRSMESVK